MSVTLSRPGRRPNSGGEELIDVRRLCDLAAHRVTDPRLHAELDAVCLRTATALNAQVALVSFLLDSAQLVGGQFGLRGWVLHVGGAPAEWVPCAEVVRTGQGLVLEDVLDDATFGDNPLFGEGRLRAYAGYPLRSRQGHLLGAHCVLSTRPRTFGAGDLHRLRDGAREAEQVLAEHRHRAASVPGDDVLVHAPQ
ncbi:MAG: GAF domain-containing protein [Kineosporiaceae bacterium]